MAGQVVICLQGSIFALFIGNKIPLVLKLFNVKIIIVSYNKSENMYKYVTHYSAQSKDPVQSKGPVQN